MDAITKRKRIKGLLNIAKVSYDKVKSEYFKNKIDELEKLLDGPDEEIDKWLETINKKDKDK